MRREEARAGVEFGYNDFRPTWRGIRSPSSPSRRRSRRKELVLAIVFTFLGLILIFVFSGKDHQTISKVNTTKEISPVSHQDYEWEDEVIEKLDSIIKKFESIE